MVLILLNPLLDWAQLSNGSLFLDKPLACLAVTPTTTVAAVTSQRLVLSAPLAATAV